MAETLPVDVHIAGKACQKTVVELQPHIVIS
jgi:hypothetical protein